MRWARPIRFLANVAAAVLLLGGIWSTPSGGPWDEALLAAGGLVIAAEHVIARAELRRARRAEMGQCPRCGYHLAGNPSGACPRCGAPVARQVEGMSERPPTLDYEKAGASPGCRLSDVFGIVFYGLCWGFWFALVIALLAATLKAIVSPKGR